MAESPSDFISRTLVSDCCQAPVMSGGMCSACREHCESEEENPPPAPPEFNSPARAAIERIQETASALFWRLHGPKMDGPRNETESALLEISTLAIDLLNGEPLRERPDGLLMQPRPPA